MHSHELYFMNLYFIIPTVNYTQCHFVIRELSLLFMNKYVIMLEVEMILQFNIRQCYKVTNLSDGVYDSLYILVCNIIYYLV